jgi:quinol monooxygenase YgiN
MIEVRVTLKPKAGKHTEIHQTLESIAAAILTHRGCLGCDFGAQRDGSSFTLVQTWSDHTDVDSYFQSREHRALIGAMGTLCAEHALSIEVR